MVSETNHTDGQTDTHSSPSFVDFLRPVQITYVFVMQKKFKVIPRPQAVIYYDVQRWESNLESHKHVLTVTAQDLLCRLNPLPCYFLFYNIRCVICYGTLKLHVPAY
jgi:hypothetical protein